MAGGKSDRFAVAEERVGRVLTTFMALGFAAIIAAAVAIAWTTVNTREYGAGVFHTQAVREAIGDLQVTIERSETARRGYLLTADPSFVTTYSSQVATLPSQLAALKQLIRDNPLQVSRMTVIDERVARLNSLRDKSIALARAGQINDARVRFAQDASIDEIRALRAATRSMALEEDQLLRIRSARQDRSGVVFLVTLAVTALLVVLVAILSLLVVTRSTRNLAASRDELRVLAASLEDKVAVRTADLSRANDEIQRFAYIVSHDLRSPLVNVMGFTAELEAATAAIGALIDRADAEAPDLVTEEARLAAREDLPESIGFIRTSTQKMDRLINAILTLSRQGRRVLAPEPLDLAGIVEGISGSLAHRLDEDGITIEIDGALPAIVSDRLAIEQILSNLIENAVKYLKPGRPGRIVVTGGRERARGWIAVADNGRGIASADHERVFDLFRRSGAQDKPGEGIGLAHVRALAYRLGGMIDLTSTLGEGATFRLSLPLTLEPQDRPQ